MRIVVITGLSGSGKTTAVKALEDEGFFCLDNLPVALFPTFVELVEKSTERIQDVAIVIDIRSKDFLKGREDVFQGLREAGHQVDILYFDATDEVLIRRFSETRRRHPALVGGTVPEGIRYEREQLAAMHRVATAIIDTSELNVHQLKELVLSMVRDDHSSRGITLHLQSFGYRYGIPLESDLVFDVRFLPNPYFVPELKQFSGLESQVREFVLAKPATDEFLQKAEALLDFLVPCYQKEGKSYLTISIGCTGGRHRSVVIAEALKSWFAGHNLTLKVTHRDIEKG
ncbi:MAG TPA: RNase adapter RapZ [Geobacteraceae bacterium]